MKVELTKMSATELKGLLAEKKVSAAEITAALYNHIEAVEPKVDAFLLTDREYAEKQAAEADRRIAAGEATGLLEGIPVAVKDNICTKDITTTCASRMLQNFRPPYEATVVRKLAEAGAVMAGKVNMDEFAMGSSCENSYFKTTKNPWDTTRVPGGSSGGSAAAVAACEVPLSLGSDTGGSIRMPASFCGVAGLKPTYGAVSRFGLVAFASSLDQIGPMARTVDDLALLFAAIAGPDQSNDATSKPFAFDAKLEPSMKGLRLGIPKEYFGSGVDAEVKQALEKAIKELEALGATAEEVSLPSTEYALSAYYIISSAEASSNLARYDGVKYGFSAEGATSLTDLYEKTRSEGFGDEVKRRIMLGTHVLSSGYYDAYYKRAKLLQKQIAAEFDAAFGKYDLLITPTTPVTAFKIGERTSDPLQMYAADVCTVPVNIAGLPAASVPCGFSGEGMPIGMQIIGPKFSEARILSAAKCYETQVGGFAVKEMA